MHFNYILKGKLSPLAWVAVVEKGKDEIDVLHGKNVECCDSFFASGVWDGEFIKGDFCNASFSHCTGGVISDKLIFSTPNHLQESIYSFLREGHLYLSNSIALLLAFTNEDLDVNYMHYEHDLNSVYFGVEKCCKCLRLASGKHFRMHRLCNIVVNNDLEILESRKCSGLRFRDFEDYYGKMLVAIQQIKDNAQSSGRKECYGMATTISRGYDAPCASVLARKVGCDVALTFGSPEKYVEDKGTEIAQKLGFKTISEGDGDAYKLNKDYWEAENAASGATGCSVQFNAFESFYKNSLLFMGVRGDSLWNKHAVGVNNDMDYLKLDTDADLNYEHYYRNNTIVIYLPMFGADNWIDIHNISNSEEMKPWSTGNDYDRPIPRRIVENEGINRYAFGYKKMGAGISFHFETLARLKAKMSEHSYKSLLDYKRMLQRNKIKQSLYLLKYYSKNYPYYLNYIFGKLHLKIHIKPQEGYLSSPISSLLILWGMNYVRNKYKQALL